MGRKGEKKKRARAEEDDKLELAVRDFSAGHQELDAAFARVLEEARDARDTLETYRDMVARLSQAKQEAEQDAEVLVQENIDLRKELEKHTQGTDAQRADRFEAKFLRMRTKRDHLADVLQRFRDQLRQEIALAADEALLEPEWRIDQTIILDK